MEIKIGHVVVLNEGPFGGMKAVVTDLGGLQTPEGVLEVCRLGVPGLAEGIEFVCPPSQFTVIGEVRR